MRAQRGGIQAVELGPVRPCVVGLAVLTALVILCSPQSAGAQEPCRNPVALFESAQNSVQILQAATRAPRPAGRQVPVCAGETIQVGDNSRAVILILASNTPLAIDQNSELVIPAAADGPQSFISLLRGALLYISRLRRATGVSTPFVNASIEGTEFLVRVLADRTVITVFEGAVRAENPAGQVLVGPGQRAVAIQNQAPQIEVVVRPRDAVQWALYYEPILPANSFEVLAQIPEANRNALFYVQRAGLLLAVGQLDEAQTDLDQAQKLDPSNSDAYALRAVVAVALNDKEGALTNGRAAVERGPQSVSARVALSYALQANFELEAGRDVMQQAVAENGGDGAAWARLAELRLMLDDVGGAADAARRAVALAPQVARVHSVRGFALLAEFRVREAEDAFNQAIALEANNPTARLGLGLTQIRRGRLSEGRNTLDVAAALTPENALVRSYLGKAFHEERRTLLSDQQYEMAKTLDPLDPTPWFYGAIQKLAQNQPVNALDDFQHAIALNDNRAVYRSRLLLDSDLAARGMRLGRIYRDLGFEELALREGWKSLATDPADYSAHRLLADGYLALPRHQIARDSELLQSQLLQPLNLNPVQPRLASNGVSLFVDDGAVANIGYNEFTRLFGMSPFRFVGDFLAAEQDTRVDNVIVSGVWDRWSYSAGQFHLESDGIRPNNDITQSIYNAFLQATISPRSTALVELRLEDSDKGDRRMLFHPDNYLNQLRNPADTSSVRLGGRHTFAPGSTLIASYVHRRIDAELNTGVGLRVLTDESADFVEVRHLQTWRWLHLTAGGGHYVGDRVENRSVGPRAFPPATTKIRHTNIYAYGTVNVGDQLSIVGGLADDRFESALDRSQTNPKIGFSWSMRPGTTVRGASFRTLKRTLISSQTIEPTHVAGFNQFFDETNATDSWRSGIAIDQAIGARVFSGLELSIRNLVVPTRVVATGGILEREEDERTLRAYAYAIPARVLAFSAEYRLDKMDRDPSGNNADLLAFATTHRLTGEGRVFVGAGGFGRLRATWIDQDGRFLHDATRTVLSGKDRFVTMTASIGWRLPRQHGVIAVDASNVLDDSFNFQDSTPEDPRILPRRTVGVRFSLVF